MPCSPSGTCNGSLVCVATFCVHAGRCPTGALEACSCAGNRAGVRTCTLAGVWGECDCPATCGNGDCESWEDATTCAADCRHGCGDGVCATNETLVGCPVDCAVLGSDQLDLLFVIDSSSGMGPKQESLVAHFADLVSPLLALPTPPDLHVGVVTADVGAGQFTSLSCDRLGGDAGILRHAPLGATCDAAHLADPADRFLRYAPDGAGGWVANFTGDLVDAFGCYAAVGTAGCTIPQPLESARLALEGCASDAGCARPENRGFLRPDAYLAVVLLTDGDDCSVSADSTLFDPAQTTLDSELGPLTPYRCFEFGTLCGGADPGRTAGPRESCFPGNKAADLGHRLTPTGWFTGNLELLKPQSPQLVYVSVIAAPPASVAVEVDANGHPDLLPACWGGMGAGEPGLRLWEFAGLMGHVSASFLTVCSPDLQQAMHTVGADLAERLQR